MPGHSRAATAPQRGARNLGDAVPVIAPPLADLEHDDARRATVPGNPFHVIGVYHYGPGSERLTDDDQRRPLADNECQHGRLPTDPAPCAECHAPGAVRLYYGADLDGPLDPMPDDLAAMPEPDDDRRGPLDPAALDYGPAIAAAAVAGQIPRPRDTVADPPQEGGADDLPAALAPTTGRSNVHAPDADAIYEDRAEGMLHSSPDEYDDDDHQEQQHDRYDDDDEQEGATWTD